MKIMHLGIAVWPSWEVANKKMWIWRKSIDRFGYQFEYYGVGTKIWPGYRKQKVESMLTHFQKHGTKGASHIFYTDCCDCLMLAPPEEIVAKYKELGEPPMLVSGSSQLGNVFDNSYPIFDQRSTKPYRYPNVGGWLMEAKLVRPWLEQMHDEYPEDQWGDDCFVWYDMIQRGKWDPVVDDEAMIWHVNDTDNLQAFTDKLGIRRFFSVRTERNHSPVILHLSGGSANHETFKDEMMIPWAKKLGIL